MAGDRHIDMRAKEDAELLGERLVFEIVRDAGLTFPGCTFEGWQKLGRPFERDKVQLEQVVVERIAVLLHWVELYLHDDGHDGGEWIKWAANEAQELALAENKAYYLD